jgi:inosine triphosphate pyrophosphatase
MSSLQFITGNKGKFDELHAIIPEVEQIDIDLPEIQEIDARNIIEAKLDAALQRHSGEFLVEDTSLYYDSMNGLPGPFVKWFLKTVGNEGLYKIGQTFGLNASVKTIIGYTDGSGKVEFFEGDMKGTIVAPRGDKGFGFDPIFEPEGFDKTLAEMSMEEKNKISTRKIAAMKLQKFLTGNKNYHTS